MSGVRLSEHFGIVIRKKALHRCNLDRPRLLNLLETGAPFDEDEELLSFGPHFGGEACQTFLKRLESAGLQYGHDVIHFSDTLPDWFQLFARGVPGSTVPGKPANSQVSLSTQDARAIWSILEALTVSLDKIGSYEAYRGTEAGMTALHAYFTPELFHRIAYARRTMVDSMIAADPGWDEELERLTDDRVTIGYWQGEGTV